MFGLNIKPENISRVMMIFLICVIWRIIIGDSLKFQGESYIFPIVGMVFFNILLGEFSRKVFRFIVPKNRVRNNRHVIDQKQRDYMEATKDIEALNFGFCWAVFWVLVVRFL